VNAGSTRFIPIQCGACRRRYGVVPVGPHRSDAGTKIRDSVNEAYGTVMVVFAVLHIQCLFLNVEINI